jgi:WD40 repeat protein
MFLDRGKDLQILSAVDGSRFATLQSPAGGIPFETLALFSPDSSLILTAGAADGRLQLWRAPEELRRGHEVRQLATSEHSAVTCAAFSPLANGDPNHALAVSGSKDGYVYVWKMPSAKQLEDHGMVGRIILATINNESSRQLRVGVEVPNPPTATHPDGVLYPGRAVTIVVKDR